MKKYLCLSLMLLISVVIYGSAYADDYWGTDGNISSPGGGHCERPEGCNYNCYYWQSCPHWTLAPISVFVSAAGQSPMSVDTSSEAYQTCTNPEKNKDGYVIFSSNYKSSEYGGWHTIGERRYFNLKNEPVNPTKSSKRLTEWVNFNGGSGYYYDDPAGKTIFKFYVTDSEVAAEYGTYKEMLDGILQKSGLNEAEISYFCAGMLDEEDDPPCTGCCPGDPYYPTCEPPASTCGEDTTVTVQQKNSSSNVSTYRNWTTNKIYAKPTDQIDYTYTYCAGVQSQAFDTVTYIEGDHGCENTDNDNRYFSAAVDWGNYYDISEPHGFNKTFTFSIGDLVKSDYSHSFEVEGDDVGDILTSTITSSYPSSASSHNDGVHEWSNVCSWECACGDADEEAGTPDSMSCACDPEDFEHTNDYYSQNTSGPDSEEVEVRIPYNYEIGNGSVNIQTNIFYAGETFTLSNIELDVIPAYSSKLQETYATKTQPATINLYSYYVTPDGATSGSVLMDTATTNSMNSGSNLGGSTEGFFNNKTYSVYDIPAGSNMCLYFVSSIGRSSSDPDSDSPSGSYTSPASCRVIYKKPSFQVWGGSVYTGSVKHTLAYKNNLKDYYNYQPKNETKADDTVFSSWAEYAVIYGKNQANATQSSLASGASTAYTSNDNGSLIFDPGGSKEPSENYCKRAPLTIANTKCASNIITKSGITPTSSVADAIYNTFIDGRSLKPASGNINLSNSSAYNEDNYIRYTSATGGSNLSASNNLPIRTTHVIYSTGTVTIASDLMYDNETPFASISQIPQYIIYAKNINILCNVGRIDGWLIAKTGTIDTCSDGGDENSAARSNQLIVNGPVIAKNAILGRTYGASTGNRSGIPAEIFNLTPVTNMWSESGASSTPTLYNQYTRELAPRY